MIAITDVASVIRPFPRQLQTPAALRDTPLKATAQQANAHKRNGVICCNEMTSGSLQILTQHVSSRDEMTHVTHRSL